MKCSRCQTEIDDNAAVCPNCNAPIGVSPAVQPNVVTIKSHLVDAILVTIFCCWPFGIPAIVQAARTNALLKNGKIAEAEKASKSAATWVLVSLILGLVGIGIYVLILVFSRAL